MGLRTQVREDGVYIECIGKDGKPTWKKGKLRRYVVAIAHSGAASSTAIGYIQVDTDSPLVLVSAHMEDTNDPTTAAPGTYGQYEMLISVQEANANYNWQNDFVTRSDFAGTRFAPREFSAPHFIQKNSKIQITIKEPAAALMWQAPAAGTMYITLAGYSIF